MKPPEFVALVLKNAARVHGYKLGHDGSDGLCDCIGLIIGAWRLGGNKWPWTHGSNYTARYLTRGLGKDQPLRLGDLVYKAREPGESGYDLPDKYKGDADQRDYYHVGVVTSASPLTITHCTTVPGGIKTDTSRGKWRYSGQFAKLEEVEEMDKEMLVYAENGGKVRLRTGPGTNYGIVAELPTGTRVTMLTDADGWAFVRHDEQQGYMMDKYLREAPAEDTGGVLYETVVHLRALLNEARQRIDEADKILGEVM